MTESPAAASGSSPSTVTMLRTRVVRPEGSATTSSPGRIVPEATCPAKPRKPACGRTAICTGKRKSTRLRLLPTLTCSRWLSSVAPSYQGICSLRLTTLSPCKAEMGMKMMSGTDSLLANELYSARIASNTACS